jgi:hypothetical protein
MIMTPTVLVVGAGGSLPYGYPLGYDLVKKIVVDAGEPNSDFCKVLGRLSIASVYPKLLANELRVSGRQSIDAFLESRNDLLPVGRLAIAYELLGNENPEKIYQTNDWYQYLFNRICDPHQFETFGRSNVSIVTFNYDRSLDFCLFSALRKFFQKSLEECVHNFNYIRIIHVHGAIGHPPTDEDNWLYGHAKSLDAIRYSADQIKIIHEIHETNDDTPEFRTARAILNEADVICFLRFGYHSTNVRRLIKGVFNLSGKRICCSGFGLTDAERKAVEKQFPLANLLWGKKDHGCLTFLRETGVLLD